MWLSKLKRSEPKFLKPRTKVFVSPAKQLQLQKVVSKWQRSNTLFIKTYQGQGQLENNLEKQKQKQDLESGEIDT